jgi:hypothetical protein
MDKPKLKIRDKEIGLRDLGDNLFEPKNSDILADALAGRSNYDHNPSFWVENPTPKERPEKYHKIQSFCFTTSINRISEAKILLKSLREHHSQPIFIHCDWFSQLVIERLGYKDLIINISKKDCKTSY